MNQIYILLGLGVVLLALFVLALVVRALQPATAQLATGESSGLGQIVSLPGLQFSNAPLLFHRADHEFLVSSPSLTAVARDLLHDRRRLVGKWLQLLQKDVLTLWRFRRVLSRHGVTTGFAEEVAIALTAVSMLGTLTLLRAAIFVAGPFAMSSLLQSPPRVLQTARRICARTFAQLPDSRHAEIRAAWLSA